jgi:hypothetical protein
MTATISEVSELSEQSELSELLFMIFHVQSGVRTGEPVGKP